VPADSQTTPSEAEPPGRLANVTPDITLASGQTRLVIESLQAGMKDVRHSDFVYMISIFGAGFVALAALSLVLYARLDEKYTKMDEKVNALISSSVELKTLLDDLIQRIPPVQAPPPRR
jgi:hypothetical protein